MSTHYKDYYGTHMPFGQFPKFGVLSSVKVLMTGTNIAGPFAASIMAEMGAQVVQVESPNMPCQTRGNYGYSQDHCNTYSIPLNTRTAKGKEVLEKGHGWPSTSSCASPLSLKVLVPKKARGACAWIRILAPLTRSQ